MKRSIKNFIGVSGCVAFAALFFFLLYPPSYDTSVPVVFNSANIPLIKVDIEGGSDFFSLDLGSRFPLSIGEKLFHAKKRDTLKPQILKDLKGRVYHAPRCLIPEIKIGNLIFKKVIAHEEQEKFKKNTSQLLQPGTATYRAGGRIGRPLLEQRNLFLDFSHNRLIFCDNLTKLIETNRCPKELSKVFLKLGRGIIFEVETDFGNKNLGLDTGCTLTYLREDLSWQAKEKDEYGLSFSLSSKFKIGGKEFGSHRLYPYEITPELTEIDGCLGMDFLKNHVVYLDFSKKIAYIGKSFTAN